jgi:hypothetical protein
MNSNPCLINCEDDDSLELTELLTFFSLRNTAVLWDSTRSFRSTDGLEKLVYQIARKPKCLIIHVQRIYHCFQNNLNEQLYAALIDFLIILNQRGFPLSWRMVLGAKSRLTSEQFQVLENYLNTVNSEPRLLSGNQFTIFTKGIIGVSRLITQSEKFDKDNDDDPLVIARDHIEYSQLSEAKQVLEKAVLERPDREDLQQEILELFKSTRDSDGFYQMLAELSRLKESVSDEWNQLNNFFKGQKSNG